MSPKIGGSGPLCAIPLQVAYSSTASMNGGAEQKGRTFLMSAHYEYLSSLNFCHTRRLRGGSWGASSKEEDLNQEPAAQGTDLIDAVPILTSLGH